jgi:membrane-associated phospholipid phosphatase
MFHVSAAALTPPLMWVVDEPLQESLQRGDPRADPFGESALWVGGLTPILAPAALYITGLTGGDAELATAGAAAIQAVVVQFVVVSTLKWLTDRAGPFPDGDPTQERWHGDLLRDSQRANDWNFNPFELSGGLRWPSGHAASNFALVSALVAFYPNELWIALLGYPFALAVSAGMVEGDYHWLSDVVAGALIGHVIGWVTGANFRERFDGLRRGKDARPRTGMRLSPGASPLGLRFEAAF